MLRLKAWLFTVFGSVFGSPIETASSVDSEEKTKSTQSNNLVGSVSVAQGVTVFLSRVTEEFGYFDEALARQLGSLPSTTLKTPEDIAGYDSGYATLDKLWQFLDAADAMIHLVGQDLGHQPPASMVTEFLQRQPELQSWLKANRLPYQNWSYIQWEVFLGKFLQHKVGGKRPRIFVCSHENRELRKPVRQEQSSEVCSGPAADHLRRLRALNLHNNISFFTDYDLLTKLMFSEFGRLVHRGSQESVIDLVELEPTLLRSAPAQALVSWPQLTAPDDKGRWLNRPELNQILEKIKLEAHSVTLLLGSPGSGKSALLARIAENLRHEKTATVPVKADYISEDVKTSFELGKELGLPNKTDIVTSVQRIAVDGTVVVLLDQLDALARLVVQNTTRLRLLTRLIQDLSGLDHVHVVASCRSFEQRHDPLLRLIEADTIELEPPEWSEVAEVLSPYKLNTENWNSELRETLRNPQALSTFVSLLNQGGDVDLMSNYQRMLDYLWEVRILADNTGNCSRVVLSIAEMLSEREALWIPVACFDEERPAIDRLVAADVLRIDGSKVGFRHQTLFEHARARSAARDFNFLVDTARSKQELLRARPQIWHGLHYLRDVDKSAYHRTLEALWSDQDLRKHLRMLLVDFMGSQSAPTAVETRIMVGAMEDVEWQARALNATVGSDGWFSAIHTQQLPDLMRACKPGREGPIRQLIISAFRFAQDSALELIRQNWMPYEDRAWLAWNTLIQVESWTPEVVDDMIHLVSVLDIADIWIDSACSTVSAHLPDQAPRLLRAWLEVQDSSDNAPLQGGTAERGTSSGSTGKTSSRFGTTLDRAKVYTAIEIARASPESFVEAVWPWIAKIAQKTAYESRSGRHSFRFSTSLDLRFEDNNDRPGEHDLSRAMDVALREWANSDPVNFLHFVPQYSHIDCLIVQRLLARALATIADGRPEAVLEFLLEDPRRFALGPEYGPHTETWELIASLIPHLNRDQRARLEEAVIKWEPYQELAEDDQEARMAKRQWARQYRLLLMQQIPEDSRSRSLSALIEDERTEFPDVKPDWGISRVASAIGSPISAEEMALMSNDAVALAILDFPDSTGWSHPSDFMKGGSIQVSRALGELAKSKPIRAMDIVRALPVEQFSRPAGTVIRELGGVISADQIFSFTEELLERGFDGDGFRSDIAHAIEHSVSAEAPLPDSLCTALEAWLGPGVTEDSDFDSGDLDREDSLLWGHGGMRAIPGRGNRPILAALSKAFRVAQPPMWRRWLALFEDHLERPEAPEVWVSMVWELKFLLFTEQSRATKFVDRLLSKYPEILPAVDTSRLLYSTLRWAGEDDFLRWIELLMRHDDPRAAQSAGELLLLRDLWFPEDSRTGSLVAMAIADPSELTRFSEPLQVGVAYTASEAWPVSQFREEATEIWMSLLEKESDKINIALSRIFQAYRESGFPADRQTKIVLQCITRCPGILKQQASEFLIENLTSLISQDWEPELVGSVAIALADQVGDTMADVSTAWPISAAMLTDIVQLLQESDIPDAKSLGVDLLEKLLENNLPAAGDLIADLDMRISASPRPALPRRQRRRPRK